MQPLLRPGNCQGSWQRRGTIAADRIRRLFWCDPEFRSVCEDYRDAVEALGRFAASDPARADEYRQLAAELLVDAADRLNSEQA